MIPSETWFDAPTIEEAEATCVRFRDGREAACATRILRGGDGGGARGGPVAPRGGGEAPPPNLLMIMIDPISRPLFDQLLPRTGALLRELNFTSFSRYTVVGDNSGPNQAALYSGQALSGGRGDISSSGRGRFRWIWDRLRQSRAGYATFKAEDGCQKNSNMIQSIRPNVTHGSALHEMLCYDFERPNCVGGRAAADHLLDYSGQFVREYSGRRRSSRGEGGRAAKPWAAFLSFTDSHEDTSTLAGTLDLPLYTFLSKLMRAKSNANIQDSTIVAVISDHGLHYGPYFPAAEARRERAQPILHLHFPDSVLRANGMDHRQKLSANGGKWATPFDVHSTLRQVMLGENPDIPACFGGSSGCSLLEPLPASRASCWESALIPDRYCELVQPKGTDMIPRRFEEMPSPPSILSFYADIPRDHRRKRQHCETMDGSVFSNDEETGDPSMSPCDCATSHRSWHSCSSHPWNQNGNHTAFPEESFALVNCPNRTMEMDIRVIRDEKIAARARARLAGQRSERRSQLSSGTTSRGESAASPAAPSQRDHRKVGPLNILFVEIDSVSIPYANRHMPKTRALLKSHEIQQSNRAGDKQRHCKSNMCGVSFEQFTLAGPNSISNQVAALSGCVTASTEYDRCNKFKEEDIGTLCHSSSKRHRGLRLKKKASRTETIWCTADSKVGHGPKASASPWLLDVATEAGYVTVFAEEFCYDGSPHITQDVIFPNQADYLVHKYKCRLAEHHIQETRKKLNETRRALYNPELWNVIDPDKEHPCVGGGNRGFEKSKVATDYIKQVWDTYSDVPRFVFLSAIAAHSYRADWGKMALAAERYDDILSEFLTDILQREDSNRTVIVVRGDHGLQGGPTVVDYSTQVEHTRPWTSIILPESLEGASLENLDLNQQRLVTGFDLYHTLRSVMVPHGVEAIKPSITDWSYNVLSDEIPITRTCHEARVPLEYCRLEFEKLSSAPGFGTCNLFEKDFVGYCPRIGESFQAVFE